MTSQTEGVTSSTEDMTSSRRGLLRQVGGVMRLLLKDCRSPEFLPIVRFDNVELDEKYKSYTSLPLQSEVIVLSISRYN